MAVESASDRAAFANTDEFGTAATYTLAAGGDTALDGIFSTPHADGLARNPGLSTPKPEFLCQSSDLPAGAKEGDRLAVGGGTYRVLDLRADQTGMTVILLG